MNIGKKIIDFIVLEDGNIGSKAAVTTGSLLASAVLGVIFTAPAEAYDHCDCCSHENVWRTKIGSPHMNHTNRSC